MTGPGGDARPGISATTRRTAGVMFAALYGELVPHPWHDPEHDAYQLFHQRSLAMGWLHEPDGDGDADNAADPVGLPGLWAMNDAGWGSALAAPAPRLISWFQVEASPVAADRPLPAQAFLRCAADTTARIGVARLASVQLLLPVQGLDASSRPPYARVPSMRTRDWFGERDPRARTSASVEINSGRDPSITTVAQQLAGSLNELDQDVFHCGTDGSAGGGSVLEPPFDDSFWNGPPRHGMTLDCELAEWSCDAIGWLAETLADSAALLGVHSPLLLTITRTCEVNNT